MNAVPTYDDLDTNATISNALEELWSQKNALFYACLFFSIVTISYQFHTYKGFF